MKPAPQKYRTANWETYKEAKVHGSLLIWLNPSMAWPVKPLGKQGCSQKFNARQSRSA
jgi:hypothetical protein